ncbi:type I secretion system permease/ATPase [Quisquiliibacterium transsilvanicum]|uniref:ATP-binding cassette subfamily C exporter for protease/lipase n=1 Tax=Quisquiliibacterium transsilvanicum TaxID=1549638 RepID=A0A7W8M9Y8_9BURK|nr:ATP-binding cassette subfamily C exporter for protease/lipase [Quisquiliibacterium transsilvanicum]
MINLLYLVPSIYMMQVYDRVLGSRNETTLVMLSLIAVGLYLAMGVLEYVRSAVLVRLGNRLDTQLAPRVFTAAFERNLRGRSGAAAGQAMNDLASVRQFVTGNGLFAFFDAPWVPIYLAVAFVFHPLLGLVAVVGAVVLFGLAWLTEVLTRHPLTEANAAAGAGAAYATANLRNAEVIEAMGMMPAVRQRWETLQDRMLVNQSKASEVAGRINAVTRFVRITLQSAALGVGGWLVLQNQISAGMMIAASILIARALAPVELLIGTWRQSNAARTSYKRLEELLADFPAREPGMDLPRPKGEYRIENVIATPPGAQTPVLKGVSFGITPGEVLVVVGPSASGKSTLARLLVGVWPAMAGKVRLDGADVFLWNKDQLGPWIGYLPQDVELFDGTIAENIARFGDVDSNLVIQAATKAGLHEMILRFAQGYDTPIGEAGSALSGGQRQRIALARALYGDPAVLVLDEPNSNLDDAGEAALVRAIRQAKDDKRTVVLVTHRTSVISVADRLLVLADGMVQMIGPRAEVLEAIAKGAAQIAAQRAPVPPGTVVSARPSPGSPPPGAPRRPPAQGGPGPQEPTEGAR